MGWLIVCCGSWSEGGKVGVVVVRGGEGANGVVWIGKFLRCYRIGYCRNQC